MPAIRNAALILLLTGCSAKGSGGGPRPTATPKPPAPPPATGALLTSVGLDGMGYRLPPLASCLVRTTDGQKVPVLATGTFKADGDLSEWPSVPALLADGTGDAAPNADLTVGAVALADDDLAVMAVTTVSDTVSLGLEFGGAHLHHGLLGGDILVRLRVAKGILERFVAGAWQAVPSELGSLSVNGSNVEIRLNRSLVGEVLTYPAWSVRLFTRDETTGITLDTTAPVYFASWLDPDKPQFTLSACTQWYTQHQPVQLVEIREAMPAAAWVSDPKALADAQDRVSGLARFAIDSVTQAFHGVNPPVLQLPIFETYGGPDPSSHEDTAAAVSVDMAPFDAVGTNPFPEGPVFRRIAARLVDAYLVSLYPAATASVRIAVNQAVVDHLVREAFGLSYFFDSYRGTLASSDSDIAWGHVLGGVMTSEQLVDAWKALAAGATPVAVFGNNTRDLALSQVGDSDFDGLPDNYEAVYGTDPKRADSDGDSWSDLAEVVNSEDPLAETRQPNRIMPDGIFDDWLTMFPQKVHVDEGSSTTCPVAADINFYAALVSRDELLIGAVARDFSEDDPHASWEAVIDMPNIKRQFLVSVPSDSFTTTVKEPDTGKVLLSIDRAFPQGRKTIEWVFSRQEFKVASNLDEPDAMRIRLRTLFRDADGKDNYCDETAWFAPYVTR